MRKFLNNPAVVLPLALLALIWGAYSYGLFGFIASKFFNRSMLSSEQSDLQRKNEKSDSLSALTMRSLIRESWLSSNWIRDSLIKNEPFVSNYDFGKETIPFFDIEYVPEETVIVDQQTFEVAIATKLGLDGNGFFVVFENVLNLPVRKRVGDEIYLRERGPLKIPTFGIAERSRTLEEQKKAVKLALDKMKLQGVGTGTLGNGVDEKVVDDNNTKNIAFIDVTGAITQIYKQGELVYRDPSLGLDKIIKGERFDKVVLVDIYQNEYELSTVDID